MKMISPQIDFRGALRLMHVTYTATLPLHESTVQYLSGLLRGQRLRLGTRSNTRALSPFKQAVLVLRWLIDDMWVARLATDNGIGKSCTYDWMNVLAGQAPRLESALLAAKMAGHSHISIDGTLIETDRVSTPGPTTGVDLWWSGKHSNHGGNIQVITAPDGWPLWTSEVRPGREHDTTAMRAQPEILDALATWIGEELPALGDLGYEGESGIITVRFTKPKGDTLTDEQKEHNKAHNGKRAVGERGNSLLKITFKALRNVSFCPWKIGTIVAAALTLLHIDHNRTT